MAESKTLSSGFCLAESKESSCGFNSTETRAEMSELSCGFHPAETIMFRYAEIAAKINSFGRGSGLTESIFESYCFGRCRKCC
jgi:hypothetical protein